MTPGSKDGQAEATYVSIQMIDDCRICKRRQDLRMGVCFKCSDSVDGELIRPGVHKLWDANNPTNSWFYSERGH